MHMVDGSYVQRALMLQISSPFLSPPSLPSQPLSSKSSVKREPALPSSSSSLPCPGIVRDLKNEKENVKRHP